MISDSPPERDLEWSDDGIKATYKFLKKLFEHLISDLSFKPSLDSKEIKNMNNDDKESFNLTQKPYLIIQMILVIIGSTLQ